MEDKKRDKSTVFVRGVGFGSSPADFEAFFSEVGPVRTSFLVRDKGQTGHKGFGFVQYALPEDAQKAAAELHNTEFQGRKLKVEAAVKRAPLEQRKKRKLADTDCSEVDGQKQAYVSNAEAQHKLTATPAATQPGNAAQAKSAKSGGQAVKKAHKGKKADKAANPKQQLVQTVALGNLAADTTAQAIELARSAGKVLEVLDPAPEAQVTQARLKQDGCTGHVVFVVYDSVKSALGAIAQLHGQKLAQQSQKPTKRHKADKQDTAAPTLWARQVSGEGLHLKKWRLIIRNLAFKVTAEDLKAALEEESAFVWDLTLPKKEDGTLKGFGFATFMTRGHAESAIKLTNGKVVAGRQVVVDWAVAKARFTDPALQDAAGDTMQQSLQHIAVAKQAEAVSADKAPTAASDQDGSQSTDEDEVAVSADPDAEQKMMRGVLDSLLVDNEDDAQTQQDVKNKTKSAGTTAPPKAAEPIKPEAAPDAKKAAGKAGKEATGQPAAEREQPGASSTGKTVFVRSLPADISKDQLHIAFKRFGSLRACRLVLDKASQQPKGTAFVEYWEASSASAAAAACQQARDGSGAGIMVGGRTVEVDVALSQDDARSLAQGKGAAIASKDNRNMYLAKEGVIEEGSAAWDSMSATDKVKRKRAAEEKNTKLRSPNFSVSRTRLSVRNIPLTMQEKALRQLFIAAVKQHASQAQPRVKQVKILRDPEKVGEADGLPRSRGLGFVEFLDHEHAICALRQLNNNPAPFGTDKRPIVEFALENTQALRKMAAKQAWQKTQQPGPSKAGAQQQQQQQQQQQHRVNAVGAAAAPAAAVTAVPGVDKQRKPKAKKQKVAKDATQQQQPAGLPAPQRQVAGSKAVRAAAAVRARPLKRPQGPSHQVVERKRKADASLDALAAQPAHTTSGAGKEKKPKQRKGEQRDALDDMVANYKVKYFSQPTNQSKAASKSPAGLSRWFE